MHSDKKLYLVFEYLDLDLKKHMDSHPNFGTDHRVVKVSLCGWLPGTRCGHSQACMLCSTTYIRCSKVLRTAILTGEPAVELHDMTSVVHEFDATVLQMSSCKHLHPSPIVQGSPP